MIDNAIEELMYCPCSGAFMWAVDKGKIKKGQLAGSIDKQTGYLQIRLNYKLYFGHRLAWFMMTGLVPKGPLDHINRVRSDNRLCNLRLTDNRKNAWNARLRKNNKSGVSGVYWNKMVNKWHAQLEDMGNKINLGLYDNLEAAAKAVEDFKLERRLLGDII